MVDYHTGNDSGWGELVAAPVNHHVDEQVWSCSIMLWGHISIPSCRCVFGTLSGLLKARLGLLGCASCISTPQALSGTPFWQPLAICCAQITSLECDTAHEIFWAGTESGGVYALQCPDLKRYACFR